MATKRVVKIDKLLALAERAKELAHGRRQRKYADEVMNELREMIDYVDVMEDRRQRLLNYLQENKDDPQKQQTIREVLEAIAL